MILHETNYYRSLEKPNKDKVKLLINEFIKEITESDPEWVKERRVEYLRKEYRKLLTRFNKIIHFDLFPTITHNKMKRTEREIKQWQEPNTSPETGLLGEQEIELARDTYM